MLRMKRRRLVALLGAGVAVGGCAAYAAYSLGWFSSLREEEDDKDETIEDPNGEKEDIQCSTEKEGKDDTIVQLDVNAHLEQHFQSIQTIATEKTISNLMIRLADTIKSMTRIEDTIEKMRQSSKRREASLKEQNGVAPVLCLEEKILMWDSVLEGAVCRFICTAWVVPMLQLQIRVQLNILGRTLYLQSSLAHHMLMASSAQEAFLSIGEYLGEYGCGYMMQKASIIGKQVTCLLKKNAPSLTEMVTMHDINKALSTGLEMFEHETITSGDWLEAVIPPEEYVDRIISRVESQEDRRSVVAMWQETVTIMKSPQFSSHFLSLCSKTLSGMISARVGEKVENAMPLVNTIPPLVIEVSQALETSSDYFLTISSLKDIQDMSARVYAVGSL